MRLLWQIATTDKQHEDFRNSSLLESWSKSHPQIFDQDDIRVARNQCQDGYHFYEWLGAVTIYNATGYLSLIEKYGMKKHQNKLAILKNVLDEETYEFFLTPRKKKTQFPDLFCYSKAEKDWFLCEVKGKGDILRPAQIDFFKEIEQITKREIRVLTIDKKNRIDIFSGDEILLK